MHLVIRYLYLQNYTMVCFCRQTRRISQPLLTHLYVTYKDIQYTQYTSQILGVNETFSGLDPCFYFDGGKVAKQSCHLLDG